MDSSAADLYESLLSALEGARVLLDVGCGRGAHLHNGRGAEIFSRFRGDGGRVRGIDIDRAGQQNPYIDDFGLIDETLAWPVEDQSIDVVFCDWVLEHVVETDKFFAELARVLRPGGTFVARTMQKWGVAGIGARIVPNQWHDALIQRLQPGMHKEDIFPTALRANTLWALTHLATDHGLAISQYSTHQTLQGYSAGSEALATVLGTVENLLPRSMSHGLVMTAVRPVEFERGSR